MYCALEIKRHCLHVSWLCASLPLSAVFTWTNLLVVVAELSGSEQEALDLVPLVTNVVLEEHHLIVGVVVIVDPGVIPINSRGEKQRMHLRDSFLADQLDPIYVAYNMWTPLTNEERRRNLSQALSEHKGETGVRTVAAPGHNKHTKHLGMSVV